MFLRWLTRAAGVWNYWRFLMGAGMNADGRLELFVRGSDGALWHKWQTKPSGGPWSDGWISLGGSLSGGPAVVLFSDQRLHVFSHGDGSLWHLQQSAPSNGWAEWESFGAPDGVALTDSPAIGWNFDQRLEIFSRGSDGNLWHIWQTAAGGSWSGWAPMGATVTGSPAVVNNADGRLEVFVRQPDDTLHHVWATGLASPWWSPWERLAGPVYGNPVVSTNADGRVEVFFVGNNHELQHMWQVQPNGGWSGTASLGGTLPVDPAVMRNQDGRLEVFQTGVDSTVYHLWQMQPNSGWSQWTTVGLFSVEGPPSAARNGTGQLEVFGISGGLAVHAWQPLPGAGVWGVDISELGSPELAAGVGAIIADLGYGLFL
jgi:hypothetical protein